MQGAILRLALYLGSVLKLGSINTGTSISKLHIVLVQIMQGTYNPGVPYLGAKYTTAQCSCRDASIPTKLPLE